MLSSSSSQQVRGRLLSKGILLAPEAWLTVNPSSMMRKLFSALISVSAHTCLRAVRLALTVAAPDLFEAESLVMITGW